MTAPHIALSGFWFTAYTPEQLAAFARQLNVSGIDYWPWNSGDLPPDEYRALLAESGLEVVCVNLPGKVAKVADGRPELVRHAVDAMDQAVALGAPSIQVYCATPPVDSVAAAADVMVESIRPIVAEARDRGLRVLVENNLDQIGDDPHGVNPSRTVEALDRVMAAVDSEHLRVCYDPANFVAVGERPFPDAYERLRPYVAAVHAKDCVPYRPAEHVDRPGATTLLTDSREGPFLVTVLGEGAVGWPAVIERLRADEYAGWYTVDPFGASEALEPWCRDSMKVLGSWLSADREPVR